MNSLDKIISQIESYSGIGSWITTEQLKQIRKEHRASEGIMRMVLRDVVKQLRSCNYTCEAGPLEQNVAFQTLVGLAATRVE